MNKQSFVDDKEIIDYVKSIKLKGNVIFENYGFKWELENLSLSFIANSGETVINYYKGKKALIEIGHIHVNNEDVINLINEINHEDKMVKITATFLGSTFEVVDKNTKKKKVGFSFVAIILIKFQFTAQVTTAPPQTAIFCKYSVFCAEIRRAKRPCMHA